MADQAQRGSRRHEPSSRPGSPLAPATAGLTPRATFWHLQQKGLTPGEAASLTAFMCGLPTADLRWSLGQINHLLFLQRLYQLGRFGIGEGERIRPH
jgi:hypothetical protein